jgi:hypothetical protein
MILRVDVGTQGEEFVDDSGPAVVRRNVERGLADLRWRSGVAAASGVRKKRWKEAVEGAQRELG